MSIVPELKPCPFCGGGARLFVDGGVRVFCSKCKASSMHLKDREYLDFKPGTDHGAVEGVIDAWNKRIANEGDMNEGSAVDAEPVRHGRWVENQEGFHCSECGHSPASDFRLTAVALLYDGFQYCGKCGAKMDGGTE